MNVFKGLLVVAAIALVLCGILVVQCRQAIDAWQAEVERLETEVTRLETQTESDFYRGVTAACTGIGLKINVPDALISSSCHNLMRQAYEADWFNEIRPDTWTWPPEKKRATP